MNDVYPGSPRSMRTPENIDRVPQAILWNPRLSAVRQRRASNLSDRSVKRVLHFDLGFNPYKIQMVQELQPLDFAASIVFCKVFDVLNNLFTFLFDKLCQYTDYAYWSAEQPHVMHVSIFREGHRVDNYCQFATLCGNNRKYFTCWISVS